VGGGRRREQLLRHQAEKARAERLTAADVDALRHDRSPEARAAVAAKFGRQFDDLAGTPQQGLALAVLELLVRDVTVEVRRTLAQAVAASPNLPQDTALRLARDEPEVACPILAKSPVLSDEALIAAVRTNVLQYALAVAGRERLAEAVGEALVGTGEREVVVRLLGNTGAALSHRALERVVRDFPSDREVEARLVRRPELPHEIVEEIVGLVGGRLEWELVKDRRMSPDEARAIMGAVRDRAAIGFTARGHGDRPLMQRLRERYEAGDLPHEELLRFLKDGDVAALELGLAIHAKLDPSHVRKLLYNADRRHMAALCVTAGLATPHYVMLRMAVDLAEATVESSGKGAAYKAETVRFLQVQYEQLARDEVKLRQLLGR
jgi:uncharacterized protein (DUF2336 family)